MGLLTHLPQYLYIYSISEYFFCNLVVQIGLGLIGSALCQNSVQRRTALVINIGRGKVLMLLINAQTSYVNATNYLFVYTPHR